MQHRRRRHSPYIYLFVFLGALVAGGVALSLRDIPAPAEKVEKELSSEALLKQ